jgi:hypothetical protein
MTATAVPREHAAHLERTSVLAMLVYCVFLAGFFLRCTRAASGPRRLRHEPCDERAVPQAP